MTPHADRDLLRFTTAGNVDDGKSTLIGRLLYDTKSILDDQLTSITHASRRLGEDRVNLALVTDALRAEREQKITIDVAYRYFATPRRRFIIADTPGHVQYTRNMVTAASTADLALIVVDVIKGVLTQSRRHAFITSMLGIPHLLVAVNKMDAVGYEQRAFDEVVRQVTGFARKLSINDISFIPVSALEGDNVVERSGRMPWYQGASLLHRLETVTVGARVNAIDFRFPVQYVIRPHQEFRGYAGSVASGSIRPDDEVVVLPSGRTTRIKSIESPDGALAQASAGDAVVLTTTDNIDISRGDMIARVRNLPERATRFDAYLCWMCDEPLSMDRPYILKHTTRQVQAFVTRIEYRVDVDTMHRERVAKLGLNDIARVELSTGDPLFFDAYRVNAATGSFILIDPQQHGTVAGGMIRGAVREVRPRQRSAANVVWQGWNIKRQEREVLNHHRAAVIWMTGMSAAGKTTIAREVERRLFANGCRTMLLDGDQLRHGLCRDLGFSPDERAENVRRAGEVAKLFFQQGCIVLCAFVSPYERDRRAVRALFPARQFIEVFVTARPDTCRARDPKGLYAKAKAGRVPNLTGWSAPYEPPEAPDLTIDTDQETIGDAASAVIEQLQSRRVISRETTH